MVRGRYLATFSSKLLKRQGNAGSGDGSGSSFGSDLTSSTQPKPNTLYL